MKLRPYQNAANVAVMKSLREFDSTLLIMATGLGKTVSFAHIAREWRTGRVLILVHRYELMRQAAEKIAAIVGEEPAIEMGSERADLHSFNPPHVTVASIQTLSRASRRERFKPDQFGLIVVDEAHHSTSSSYREVFDYFRAKRLGVTATLRGDGEALGQVYDSSAYEYGIVQAVDDGWLVPVRQHVVKVAGLDFSKARTTAGDFNENDLERILMVEEMLHKVVAPSVELIGSRPTLAFCVTVAHAHKLAEILNRYKPGCAEALDGSSPAHHRAETIDRFKSGRLQVLTNCGLFLEGFDAPATAAIIMARPTKSLCLYTQVLGRSTSRPLPGIVDGIDDSPAARRAAIAASAKPDSLILDFVGNAGRHKIVTAVDVLGGKWSDTVKDYFKVTLEEEEESEEIEQGMARAESEVELENEQREIMRRKNIVADAAYTTHEESPFAGGSSRRTEAGFIDKATSGQVWKLKQLGFTATFAEGCSKRQASAVIGKKIRELAGK